MPPAKVRIEKIESQRVRQHTFLKRKTGLIKKAIELTILCDCDVSIIINKRNTSANARSAKLVAYSNRNIQDMIGECWDDLEKCAQVNNSVYPKGKSRSAGYGSATGSDEPLEAIPVDFDGDDLGEDTTSDIDYAEADHVDDPAERTGTSCPSTRQGIFNMALTCRAGKMVNSSDVPNVTERVSHDLHSHVAFAGSLDASLGMMPHMDSVVSASSFQPPQPNHFMHMTQMDIQNLMLQQQRVSQSSMQDLMQPSRSSSFKMDHDFSYGIQSALLSGRDVPPTIRHSGGQATKTFVSQDSFHNKREHPLEKGFALGKAMMGSDVMASESTYMGDWEAVDAKRQQFVQRGKASSLSQGFSTYDCIPFSF